jgi:RNA polymerase sigma-70 factor (ECF subfamily)
MAVSPSQSFGDLMVRLRLGDDAAAAEVHGRYVRRLVALACTHLDARTRAKADPEDVVQSAFRSFFRRCEGGAFEASNWDALWALLAVITVRKCRDRRRNVGAQRRDAAREQPWDGRPEADQQASHLLVGEPTPEQAAMLAETLAQWLSSLDAAERAVVELGLMGHDDADIARQLMRSQRTVRRLRLQVEQRLQTLCLEP